MKNLKNLNYLFISLAIASSAFFFGFSVGKSSLQSQPRINIPNVNLNLTNKAFDSSEESSSQDMDLDLLWQIWQHVQNNYVEKGVLDSQLYYGALAGIVASLNDPYSVFLKPEDAKKFEQELSGQLEGIGAEIGLRDDQITIIAPLPESPAEKAGIRPGDKVLAINDTDTYNMSLDYAVSLIRGKKGTKVKLLLLQNSDVKPVELEITRGVVNIVSVRWKKQSKDIAYIELKYFNQDTLSKFQNIAKEIVAEKPKGIILDLRNNPGGLLDAAIGIAAEWIGSDEIIVIEKKRDKQFVGNKANNSKAQFKDIPTVVLINKGSASGSEIVAGALQDYKLSTLVGEVSFGKGSVQDLTKFSDGSTVKLTVAKWLTPAGREIDKVGINPDIEVKMTSEDYEADKDPQLDKALELLK